MSAKTKEFKISKFLNRRGILSALPKPILLAGLLVFAGSLVLVKAQAISAILFEAEAGTRTGNASVVSDANASGGNALRFDSAPGTNPYADVPSNYNVNDWLINNNDPLDDFSWEPSGGFRFLCQFSHLGYYDPIVYPGQADKGHLHMFFGNKSIDHNSTYASLRSSGEGSCPGGPINRTGYWMPAVFDANDSNKVVITSFFNVYYKDSPCPINQATLAAKQDCIRNTHDIPNGLRMIAGYDMNGPANQDSHIDWYCDTPNIVKTKYIPDSCLPGETLIVSVQFPTCWDGVNLDSPNHRSHVAYYYNDPEEGARCPATHQVHLPSLTEFAFFTNPGNISGWSLASDHMAGMTHTDGSTFHADWFGAWDNDIKLTWLQNCIRNMKSVHSGRLCNGKQLKEPPAYTGPTRISGYTVYSK